MNFTEFISSKHIYKEFNGEVDLLSMKAIGNMDVRILFHEFSDGVKIASGYVSCYNVV